jgi:metallo-beta-lactamase family protein
MGGFFGMNITFHGAARTVTGSQHLIEINGRQILLDCGMYQGRRQEAFERNRKLPFDANRVDVMVLSHAHIDHSGNVPNLVKSGFDGDIYATFATRDLCAAMLMDSAHIQESDVAYVNKHRSRKGETPVEPIYTSEDAVRALKNFHAVGYDRAVKIMPGVTLTFVDAGHMLGSSIVILQLEDREENRDITLVFSGDLGQPGLPILRDPTKIDRADVLIMESTYGDRNHDSYADSERTLARIVNETYKRGGKLIIPAFAVGRTQEIVYALHKLSVARKIPLLKIFVDSPLAVNVTEVFSAHPECYDAETRDFISGQAATRDPFGFRGLHYTRSVEESKELNFLREPAVIISASGMAETGRILHHLKNNIEDERNTVLIAGFQAEHTLGRRIEEKEESIKIFGEPYRLRAQVERITGFSAHADRDHLLGWAGAFKKKPVRTFLVHGEDKPLNALAEGLRKEVGLERVDVPDLGQSFGV